MRAFLSIVLLAICCTANAFAEPTYVLFDTSSSMKDGKRLLAIEQAKGIIDKLAPEAKLSVNYFGGSCSTPTINTPMPKSENPAFAPPKSGGSTPLGAALEATFESARHAGGDIYVYSDGNNYCPGVDVCEVARAYLSVYPNINLHFQPISPNSEDEDKLGCLKAARQPVNAVSIPIDPAPTGEAEPLPWVGWALLITGIVLAWSVGAFIHVWGGHWVAVEKYERDSIARKNATEEQKAVDDERVKREAAEAAERRKLWETEHPKKKYKEPKPKQRHLLSMTTAIWMSFWPLGVVALVDALLLFVYPSSFEQARSELWWFAETSFGSKFLPAVLMGFIGWALIRLWEFTLLRRDKISDAVLLQIKQDQKAVVTAQRKADQSKAAEKRNARVNELLEQNKVQAAKARDDFAEQVEVLKATTEDEAFDEVAQHLASIRERIEGLIASFTDTGRLAKYGRSTRGNYTSVVSDLQWQRILAYDIGRELIGALSAWTTYNANGVGSAAARERIMAFEPDRIHREGSS
jgi:hypothetical protein